jgi:DCN1-like protein 4/5
LVSVETFTRNDSKKPKEVTRTQRTRKEKKGESERANERTTQQQQQPTKTAMGQYKSKSRRLSLSSDGTTTTTPTRRERRSNNTAATATPGTATATATATPPGWSRRKAEELFGKYQAGGGADHVGPDEVVRLCGDLGVAPEDVGVLVLAWHLGAKQMGFFTRAEWLDGMQRLKVETLPQLRARVRAMRAELDDAATLRDVYRFAFVFSRERDAKVIDAQTADGLLALLLGPPAEPAGAPVPLPRGRYVQEFREFLKNSAHKSVNMDQWTSFLDFSLTIARDLSNYDEAGAWPVMLDEFVQYLRTKPATISV